MNDESMPPTKQTSSSCFDDNFECALDDIDAHDAAADEPSPTRSSPTMNTSSNLQKHEMSVASARSNRSSARSRSSADVPSLDESTFVVSLPSASSSAPTLESSWSAMSNPNPNSGPDAHHFGTANPLGPVPRSGETAKQVEAKETADGNGWIRTAIWTTVLPNRDAYRTILVAYTAKPTPQEPNTGIHPVQTTYERHSFEEDVRNRVIVSHNRDGSYEQTKELITQPGGGAVVTYQRFDAQGQPVGRETVTERPPTDILHDGAVIPEIVIPNRSYRSSSNGNNEGGETATIVSELTDLRTAALLSHSAPLSHPSAAAPIASGLGGISDIESLPSASESPSFDPYADAHASGAGREREGVTSSSKEGHSRRRRRRIYGVIGAVGIVAIAAGLGAALSGGQETTTTTTTRGVGGPFDGEMSGQPTALPTKVEMPPPTPSSAGRETLGPTMKPAFTSVPPPTMKPPCNPNPCENGGTCSISGSDAICDCPPNYFGPICQDYDSPCNPNPCVNGGTCSINGSDAICDCPPNYFGPICQDYDSPCNPNPCENGGTCSIRGSDAICDCPPNYSGPICQNYDSPCNPNPCDNGGTCSISGSDAICSCPPNYSDPICQNYDSPCSPNPCDNGGTCSISGSDAICDCPPNYIGPICQDYDSPCIPNPCDNGGTCSISGSDAICDCPPNYSGPICQDYDSPCEPSPCENGGTCLVSGSNAVCLCQAPYSGARCQIYEPPTPTPCTGGLEMLVDSDGATGDRFGISVAVSTDGNTVLVGAKYGNSVRGLSTGSAHVFSRTVGGGPFKEIDVLAASDGVTGDEFGASADISGDTIVVGSPYHDNDKGAAYVFSRWNGKGGSWEQTEKLTAPDVAREDYFGNSVAISSDEETIVIGSFKDNEKMGSVYVFSRAEKGSWKYSAKLTASDGGDGDYFGGSIAISGSTLVVGAYREDSNGSKSGSAYVFSRTNGGKWEQTQKLVASDGKADDQFGFSVAVFGDDIVIGAYYSDGDNGNDSGSAYVFSRANGGKWKQTQKLVASDGKANDRFGTSVAISRGVIVIGASGRKENEDVADAFPGQVYIFSHSDNSERWVETSTVKRKKTDYLGRSITISGNVVVIGEPRYDYNGITDSGAAFVHELC